MSSSVGSLPSDAGLHVNRHLRAGRRQSRSIRRVVSAVVEWSPCLQLVLEVCCAFGHDFSFSEIRVTHQCKWSASSRLEMSFRMPTSGIRTQSGRLFNS